MIYTSSLVRIWVFLALYGLLLASGCREADQDNATTTPQKITPKLEGYLVTPTTLTQTVFATGNLMANELVELKSQRMGLLTKLNYKEGDFVSEGDIIATVDDAQLQAQKKKTLIDLQLAENEFARGSELLKIEGISQEELQRLENQVQSLKADLQILDVEIEQSKISAPFAGYLGLRKVSPGAFLNVGTPIGSLQQISPIKIEFDVPERHLPDVQSGQSLQFQVEGFRDTFRARVYAIDRSVSAETRTFKVRAKNNNVHRHLTPGQLAKITLVTGQKASAYMVPTDAVIPVLDGKVVYRVQKGTVSSVAVVTGERTSDKVEIIDGISDGDTVLVSGLLSVDDGDQVDVIIPNRNQVSP